MKIAFPATGNGWQEKIDARFGRAAGFFVVDTGNKSTLYLHNRESRAAGHGAGTRAAETVARAGVDKVVAVEVGPKAASALSAAGIDVVRCASGATIADEYKRVVSS